MFKCIILATLTSVLICFQFLPWNGSLRIFLEYVYLLFMCYRVYSIVQNLYAINITAVKYLQLMGSWVLHRKTPTALHFMKELRSHFFTWKKEETSTFNIKIICVPFQAATILLSRCGLGRFCLSLYKRVLHFSTISLTSVGFKENFTAVSSKDSLTNNTFWFFNSSWGSCKCEKQIPSKYNVKSWSTNTSIYSLW